MARVEEIIDLDSSSDEELLLDGEHLREITPVLSTQSNDLDQEDNFQIDVALDPEVAYTRCLQEITEVFPDVSLDYVRQLYDAQVSLNELGPPDGVGIAQLLIERILDTGKYPKERDRQKEASQLKRKRESQEGDDEEATRWRHEDLKSRMPDYSCIS